MGEFAPELLSISERDSNGEQFAPPYDSAHQAGGKPRGGGRERL